jgi:peroxiredoxin family protein
MSEYNGEIRKMMIILSKATLENVYAAFVLANGARMEGIEAEMFFTFFGLEAVHKKKLEHLHVATVGNPAMHMPTLLGGLPGMEALATHMMKKEMEKIDMPDVHEFLDILQASGVKLWACKLAMEMFHYTKEDMIDGLDGVITVGDFYKQGNGIGTHMLFI